MTTGRHANINSHHSTTGSKLGNISYIGILFLLISGGFIVGLGFIIAYVGARLYFGLPITG